MSQAERVLWYNLRARRFYGWKFRHQVPIGPYVVDFLCPERRLIVEIDGDTHSALQDAGRDAWLAAHGYRIVRVSNLDVLTNLEGVLDRLAMELSA